MLSHCRKNLGRLKMSLNSQIETKELQFSSNSKNKGCLRAIKMIPRTRIRITHAETKICSSVREIFSRLLQILQILSTTITLTTSLLPTLRKLHRKHSSCWSSPKVQKLQHLSRVSSKIESRRPTKSNPKEQTSTALNFRFIQVAWGARGQRTRPSNIAKTHF